MNPVPTIGTAVMLPDGTLKLRLRAIVIGGPLGDAQVVYPTHHPQYAMVLQHLGGLEPGQTKPCPAFP